jgi:photosystem II stability/assembly factor-like uncharacterized protein
MHARIFYALMLWGTLALVSGTAFANGRFPRAQRLVEEPAHPERLIIAATYGLLVTGDRGKSWSYVCDAAFTFQPMFASDVVVGLTTNGLLLGVQNAITLTRDRGCDFTKVFEPTGQTNVDDFTISPSLTDVLALVTTFENGRNTIRLQESQDGGLTWRVIGAPLPADLTYTIDVDPRNAQRVYATGAKLSSDPAEPALFLTSLDRGSTWTVDIIPNTSMDSSPWIAAIHPTDGNKIFVRTDSWKKNASSQELAGDALLYSDDGGKTWTELIRAAGADPEEPGAKMLGFALSPDGSTVLVGYGDIVDPVRVVDPDDKWKGVYKSSSDGRYSFGAGAPAAPVPLLTVPSTCLAWTQEGIYACLAPKEQSHYLAFTADPNFASASLTTLMKASEVQGSPRCCDGRSVNACIWMMDCQVLGACDAGPPPGRGTCDDAGGAGGGPSTDAGHDAGTGGTTGGAAGAGGRAGGSSGAGGATADDNPCGCRLSRRSDDFNRSTAALLLTGLLARFRRRTVVGARSRRQLLQ